MEAIRNAFRAYIDARRALLALSKLHLTELSGNDNMVGRLGEYLAVVHLRSIGLEPKKAPSKSQRGFDLVCGRRRFSVKILTSENERGRSTRLKDPWTDFILIAFHFDTLSYKLAHITRKQFAAARRRDQRLSKNPVVKASMLGKRGLVAICEGAITESVL